VKIDIFKTNIKNNNMNINKNFAIAFGYKDKDLNKINIQLTASKNSGKDTKTIICPKNKDFKPFLIINN